MVDVFVICLVEMTTTSEDSNKPNKDNETTAKELENHGHNEDSSKMTKTNDTNLLNYPRAPIHPLPTRQFICIEYPGYIKNVHKAIETVGGLNAIYQVFE